MVEGGGGVALGRELSAKVGFKDKKKYLVHFYTIIIRRRHWNKSF
jgi:hypothetical protein